MVNYGNSKVSPSSIYGRARALSAGIPDRRCSPKTIEGYRRTFSATCGERACGKSVDPLAPSPRASVLPKWAVFACTILNLLTEMIGCASENKRAPW
jgi:hypothetical protein